MRKILFILLCLFFCVACGEPEIEKTHYLDNLSSTYTIKENEEINFNELISTSEKIEMSTNDLEIVSVDNNKVCGICKGEAEITIKVKEESRNIKIIVLEVNDFYIEDLTLYKGETKELNIEIIKGNIENLILEKDNENINILENKYIEAIAVGNTIIKATLGEVTKEVKIEVLDWEINILNEEFEVDIFETLELKIKCPSICEDLIQYNIYKEDVIKIEDNVIHPLKEGITRVVVQIGDNKDYSVSFSIRVTVDPLKIIKMLHNEEALMRKSITLYGGTSTTQSLLGSVSRYMFADLNLEKQIIDIYTNPYVGMTATKEIVEALDRKGYPRSGVKMEAIQYITYHDTGNNAAGANAQSNANWMTNQYSVTTSARSWHYTVDENKVIQSIPDDEITFQGDHYDAYTKSIGIETCVNAGANMNVIWHRMGKLCAQLMTKYDLEVTDIKQHYDWNQKECPQTLRRNGLYKYAISLVEGELLVRKYLSNYKLEFESLNPEFLSNSGQIIKAPSEEITVGYKVTITNNKGYNESITLYTKVKPL